MAIATEINGTLGTEIDTLSTTINGTLGTEINGTLGADYKSPQEKTLVHYTQEYHDRPLLDLTRECLDSAAQYARHIQNSDGHWCGELRSNPTVTCEYVFLYQALGLDLTRSRESIRPWLLSQQKEDGSWGIAPDYPGDVSTSVEAYLALKLLQIPAENPVMQRARAFILSVGGLAKVRIFTRIYLATFGLYSWSDIPEMPVELVFMPSWAPINIYKLSSWARSTIMPLLILCHHRPVYPLPNGTSATNNYIDELWLVPQKNVPYSKSLYQLLRTDRIALSFAVVDKVLIYLNGLRSSFLRTRARRMCLKWVLEHQEVSGDWAGIFPPMHLGLLALNLEGYKVEDDCMQRGFGAIERFAWQDSGGRRIQACVSPVWDTALMIIGISDCGLLKDTEDMRKAVEWVQHKQLLGLEGDWRVYSPQTRSGGFSFEYFNTWYPDVDDTAAVILAFLKHDVNRAGSTSVLDAVEWVLGMQNSDGGWAAFDINNDALFLNKIPFSDMDSLSDPSSADVTGRVIEAFGLFTSIIVQRLNKFAPTESFTRANSLADRVTGTLSPALAYLARTQEPSTGAWYGRWGSNYVYGTSNVLCSLAVLAQLITLLPQLHSSHSDAIPFHTDGYIQGMVDPALAWLKNVQNTDGGFGEQLQSYTNPALAGCGPSTASQTAWGLMGLLAFLPADDPAVERAVRWLLSMQRTADGGTDDMRKLVGATWPETAYTGTGFPGFFYIGAGSIGESDWTKYFVLDPGGSYTVTNLALESPTLSTFDNVYTSANLALMARRSPGMDKVIIIGAGCTGCALGQGLKKAGIPCVIYEARDTSLPSREWNMGLHWAVPGLRSLIPDSLWAKIQLSQVDPHYPTGKGETLPFIHGENGAVLAQLAMDDLYRLHRNRFRDLLSDGLDIREEKVLTSITCSDDGQTVTAHFADGSEDCGSILVGADGPRSTTRRLLLGIEKSRNPVLDYAATMCFTKYKREQALFLRSPPAHPLFQVAPHPGNLFAVLGLHNAPDLDKPEDWTFFHYISFPEPRDMVNTKSKSELVAHQKELASRFADPFKSAFEWMPSDSELVWYGKMNHWDPSEPDHRWDTNGGRITLAGDAAHPMTFQRGQGLNHAITDAVKLCGAITGTWHPQRGFAVSERAANISAYETEMIARGGEEVRLSAKNTGMVHDWKQVMQSPVFKSGLNQGK